MILQTTKPIYLGSKQNRENYVLICLNVLIAKRIIKWILISVPSRSITSIGNSMPQNIRKSEIIGSNQFTQL